MKFTKSLLYIFFINSVFIGKAQINIASQPFSENDQAYSIDTIYYDKDCRGLPNMAFADYYRIIIIPKDESYPKKVRDYYLTGELKFDANYIAVDKNDDTKSIFDGQWINYYRSGQTAQQGMRINGKQVGEYTSYYENGAIKEHAYFRNNKLNGTLSEYDQNDGRCIQTEYSNGIPKYNYYIVSDKDGNYNKFSLEDGSPIFDPPQPEEKQTEYNQGKTFAYYNKNGVIVGTSNEEVKAYGEYYQICIAIINKSMITIDFDPDEIEAYLQKENGEEIELFPLAYDEYIGKVKRRQTLYKELAELGGVLSTLGAGYSTSTTETTYNGRSESRGSATAYGTYSTTYGNYSGSTDFRGSSTSTTRTYDNAKVREAQAQSRAVSNQINETFQSQRDEIDAAYLKRTTLYPGDKISGYINIKKKSGAKLNVHIYINGVAYTFPWEISR